MELQGTLQMIAGGVTLDSYMLLLLGVMVFTGTLGGLANYFRSEKTSASVGQEILKYVLLGIVAAFTVPLLLNMISSDLLAVAKSRPNDLYVFGALCLAFVLFSRRFMESATSKPMP